MRREFLNLFLTWEMITLVASAFILFSIVCYYIAHRYFRPYLINTATHNTSGVFNILSLSTILMAFTIVILWQYFVKAEDSVAQETTALEEIVYYSQALPKSAADDINKIIGNYVYLVVNNEWSAMREGQQSPETNTAIKVLYDFLVNHEPSNENERLFFSKIIDKYENVLNARDIRLDAVYSVIPSYFFAIMIINLLLLIISVCLLDEKGQKAPFVISLLVAIMAGINTGLTLSLDYPFSGDFAVSSEPYTLDILGPLYQQHQASLQ